jgi:predicted nucleotidyltransferase
LRKASWSTFAPSSERYDHSEAVGRFVARAARELRPLALILFGSLARGDHHRRSDADVCVVLAKEVSFFEGYDCVAALDPSGVVQPVVYGADAFREMVRTANGLALEVLADGVFLAGDEAFRREIEALAERTRQRLGIERTPTGWRIAHPERVEETAS